MHLGSVEKHCKRFKMQWKCSSMQWKNATTLFSLSLLFPKRVTFLKPFVPPRSSTISFLFLYKHIITFPCLSFFSVIQFSFQNSQHNRSKISQLFLKEPCSGTSCSPGLLLETFGPLIRSHLDKSSKQTWRFTTKSKNLMLTKTNCACTHYDYIIILRRKSDYIIKFSKQRKKVSCNVIWD